MPRDRYVVRPNAIKLAAERDARRQLHLFGAVKLRRVWYPYQRWEEYHAGMWRVINASAEHDALLKRAIVFTGDAAAYGAQMQRVIHAWPISCAMNLTTIGMNRHAWVGHAACSFHFGCPEHIVREAWHFLTQRQQDDANAEAERAIRAWESTYGAHFQ